MKREHWIDYIKTIACLAVVAGHFFQSMVRTGIVEETMLYSWFIKTIYYFQVPCFFLASGYLHQSTKKKESTYVQYVGKKFINIGIPYVAFTGVTFFLKVIFKNDVNISYDKSIFYYLLVDPISPYWFLYTLFLCYLIFPVAKNKKLISVFLTMGFIMKFIVMLDQRNWFQPLNSLMASAIFFVFGMAISFFDLKILFERKWVWISILFIPITIITFGNTVESIVAFLISCLGILFIIVISLRLKYIEWFDLSKYFLHIYLLHTIFAAGMRSILLKFGIQNFWIHLFFGILASILFPIIIGELAKRNNFIDFFFEPYKVINKRIKKIS